MSRFLGHVLQGLCSRLLPRRRQFESWTRGRKQVNKALHTCTSWYAYAAMIGSSIDTMVPQALERMYRLH